MRWAGCLTLLPSGTITYTLKIFILLHISSPVTQMWHHRIKQWLDGCKTTSKLDSWNVVITVSMSKGSISRFMPVFNYCRCLEQFRGIRFQMLLLFSCIEFSWIVFSNFQHSAKRAKRWYLWICCCGQDKLVNHDASHPNKSFLASSYTTLFLKCETTLYLQENHVPDVLL